MYVICKMYILCITEFSSVKAWVDQLILKQNSSIQQLQKKGGCAQYEEFQPHVQASRSSSPPPLPPVLNGPAETPIEETGKPQKNIHRICIKIHFPLRKTFSTRFRLAQRNLKLALWRLCSRHVHR